MTFDYLAVFRQEHQSMSEEYEKMKEVWVTVCNELFLVVVGRWSIIIESWSKNASDATIDYASFIIDCRGKIKNLLGTNKSIKINKVYV